jgi:hypothetical protein
MRECALAISRIFDQSVPVDLVSGTDKHGQRWAWAEVDGKIVRNAVPIEDELLIQPKESRDGKDFGV